MTADDVTRLVSESIAGRWSETNLHAVDLRERLLQTPLCIEAIDAAGEERLSVWLVLTENGEGKNGYGVAYVETDQAFGLLQFATGYDPCLVGIYGTFWQAFEAM